MRVRDLPLERFSFGAVIEIRETRPYPCVHIVSAHSVTRGLIERRLNGLHSS